MGKQLLTDFKMKICKLLFDILEKEDDYMEIPMII